MGYVDQQVLRLPENCALTSLDIEDDLAEVAGSPRDDPSGFHAVYGNSYGAGTIEFFIHTNDPHSAFELTKPLLASAGLLDMVTAGYRRFTDDEHEVIWPSDFVGDFHL